MLLVVLFTVSLVYSEDLVKILDALDSALNKATTEQTVQNKPKIKAKIKAKVAKKKILPKIKKVHKPEYKISEKISVQPEPQKQIVSKRYFGVTFSYYGLFRQESCIAESFVADINANAGDLSTISYYNGLSASFYYHINKWFTPYLETNYMTSFTRSSTASLNYGLETIETTASYGIDSINFSLGTKINIVNYKNFELNLIPLVGFAFLVGNLALVPKEQGSLGIEESYLGFTGKNIFYSLKINFDFKLRRKLLLGLSLFYQYLEFNKIVVSDSAGEFSSQYETGKQLAIYNNTTKAIDDFYISLSSFGVGILLELRF